MRYREPVNQLVFRATLYFLSMESAGLSHAAKEDWTRVWLESGGLGPVYPLAF